MTSAAAVQGNWEEWRRMQSVREGVDHAAESKVSPPGKDIAPALQITGLPRTMARTHKREERKKCHPLDRLPFYLPNVEQAPGRSKETEAETGVIADTGITLVRAVGVGVGVILDLAGLLRPRLIFDKEVSTLVVLGLGETKNGM